MTTINIPAKAMRLLSYSVFSIFLLMGSCYYDDPPLPAEIDPELVSFNNHLVPIFERACDSPGCHDTGAVPPDLTAENAYDALLAGGYVNTTLPASSVLYLRVDGTSAGPIMPPEGRLTQLEVDLILAWIQKGALND